MYSFDLLVSPSLSLISSHCSFLGLLCCLQLVNWLVGILKAFSAEFKDLKCPPLA